MGGSGFRSIFEIRVFEAHLRHVPCKHALSLLGLTTLVSSEREQIALGSPLNLYHRPVSEDLWCNGLRGQRLLWKEGGPLLYPAPVHARE